MRRTPGCCMTATAWNYIDSGRFRQEKYRWALRLEQKRRQAGCPARQTGNRERDDVPLPLGAPNNFGTGGGDAVATFPCPANTRCFLRLISLFRRDPQAGSAKWSCIIERFRAPLQGCPSPPRAGRRWPACLVLLDPGWPCRAGRPGAWIPDGPAAQVLRDDVPASRARLGGPGPSRHLMIFATTPAPTVRPPSRIAKRRPSSIATGLISDTTILMLSPGMTISTPSGSVTAPVMSVVRK